MALRTCIAFILLLISAPGYSQYFEGGFINNEEGYYFWKDGEFSWYSVKSNTRSLGHGKYTATKDSIVLTFDKAQREFELQAPVPVPHGLSHSVVAVTAMKSSGKPFAGLTFALRTSNVTGVTDRTGTAQVRIQDAPVSDNIHFELDGYRTIDMSVDLRGKDLAFAVVVDETIKYVENTLIKFKLKRSSRGIVLNGTAFKKVSKRKFLDKYQGA